MTPFEKITPQDLAGKGNLGRPDTPGVPTEEMQRIMDEIPREVIVPKFNKLVDGLNTLPVDTYGDMKKAVYDANGDGVVDNTAALNGHPDSYFATATALEATSVVAEENSASILTLQGDIIANTTATDKAQEAADAAAATAATASAEISRPAHTTMMVEITDDGFGGYNATLPNGDPATSSAIINHANAGGLIMARYDLPGTTETRVYYYSNKDTSRQPVFIRTYIEDGTVKQTFITIDYAGKVSVNTVEVTGGSSGDMTKAVYDTNDNGIVDNAEALNGHTDAYFATATALSGVKTTADNALSKANAAGDMEKSVYDKDGDGIVDNAKKLGSHPVSFFATSEKLNTVRSTANDALAKANAAGDMAKATYDTDNSGVVDDAEKLGGQLPAYYAPATALDGCVKTTGNQTVDGNLTAKYLTGTWLQTKAATKNNALTKIAMIDASGWVYYMDKSQLVNDVIAAIPKWNGGGSY